jgi:hypothetical protein
MNGQAQALIFFSGNSGLGGPGIVRLPPTPLRVLLVFSGPY